ncbi:MAG: hypothetical protein M1824_003509 [Vezdaea acicularis]|nr:MAG: hypothetical protein M1824_003509 [Vezdaea acicularis]
MASHLGTALAFLLTSLFSIGAGLMAYGYFGVIASDKAEEIFGLTPTEEDRERLREVIPKIDFVEKGAALESKKKEQ